jgi:hypothetical protein
MLVALAPRGSITSMPFMAARTPRRSFASPFVVTLATAPACFVSSSTPPSQPISQTAPGQPVSSDPQPATPPPSDSPIIIANPPHPTSTPSPSEPAPPPEPRQWTVFQTATGCEAAIDAPCPVGAICNPPRPTAYACPHGVKLPAKVFTSGDGCAIEHAAPPCPEHKVCGPPPKQKVPCPR